MKYWVVVFLIVFTAAIAEENKTASPIWGLTMSISTGINPNLMNFSESISSINRSYTEFAERQSFSLKKSYNSALGVPIGMDMRFFYDIYIVKIGVFYMFLPNCELRVEKDTEYYDTKVSISEVYIPFSIYLNMKVNAVSRLFIGGGINYLYGNITITTDNGEADTIADKDVYSGQVLGFHFAFGTEIAIASSWSLSFELNYIFGTKGIAPDKNITNSDNAQDRESDYNPQLLGASQNLTVPNPSIRETDTKGLNFNGLLFIVALNYFL